MILQLVVIQLHVCASLRYLVLRHGETNHNAAGIIQGSSDVSRLSDKGCEQARAAGAALGRLDDLHITRVLCSPLARARQTLELVCEAAHLALPEPQIVPSLREIDLHSWEGRPKSELQREFAEQYCNWKRDPLAFTVDGHHPVIDLWARAAGAWADDIRLGPLAGERETAAETTLLVCHSACGQALLSTARGGDARDFRLHEFPNCGMVELEWPGEAHGEARGARATRWRWRLPEQGVWSE